MLSILFIFNKKIEAVSDDVALWLVVTMATRGPVSKSYLALPIPSGVLDSSVLARCVFYIPSFEKNSVKPWNLPNDHNANLALVNELDSHWKISYKRED